MAKEILETADAADLQERFGQLCSDCRHRCTLPECDGLQRVVQEAIEERVAERLQQPGEAMEAATRQAAAGRVLRKRLTQPLSEEQLLDALAVYDTACEQGG